MQRPMAVVGRAAAQLRMTMRRTGRWCYEYIYYYQASRSNMRTTYCVLDPGRGDRGSPGPGPTGKPWYGHASVHYSVWSGTADDAVWGVGA